MKHLRNYFRIFPDHFPKHLKRYLGAFGSIVPYLGELLIIWSVAILGVLSYVGFVMIEEYRQTSAIYQEEITKLAHWEQVIQERPEYPGAYFQAGIYSLRLKNTQKALDYFQKALLLDPNYTQAEVFAQEIEQ